MKKRLFATLIEAKSKGLQNLTKNKDLVMQKAGKGITQNWLHTNMKSILSGSKKFVKLKIDEWK